MRTFFVIASIAIIGGVLVFSLFSNNNSDEPQTLDAAALAEGTVVYDVRTPEEFASSHGEGAILLPLQDIQAGKYPDVEKDSPIAVYCRSGNRSAQATRILKDAGFTNITDIGGLDSLARYDISLVR